MNKHIGSFGQSSTWSTRGRAIQKCQLRRDLRSLHTSPPPRESDACTKDTCGEALSRLFESPCRCCVATLGTVGVVIESVSGGSQSVGKVRCLTPYRTRIFQLGIRLS